MIAELPELERDVITLRYGLGDDAEPLSVRAVGELLDLGTTAVLGAVRGALANLAARGELAGLAA